MMMNLLYPELRHFSPAPRREAFAAARAPREVTRQKPKKPAYTERRFEKRVGGLA